MQGVYLRSDSKNHQQRLEDDLEGKARSYRFITKPVATTANFWLILLETLIASMKYTAQHIRNCPRYWMRAAPEVANSMAVVPRGMGKVSTKNSPQKK